MNSVGAEIAFSEFVHTQLVTKYSHYVKVCLPDCKSVSKPIFVTASYFETQFSNLLGS